MSGMPPMETLCEIMFRDYPDVLNVSQMSEILHVSTKTGRRLLREGTVRSVRIGKSYRIPKAYLISYVYPTLPQNVNTE